MKYGLIKVAAAIPAVKVADTKFNLAETEKQIAIAEGKGVEVIVFPELSLTGYSCQDYRCSISPASWTLPPSSVRRLPSGRCS